MNGELSEGGGLDDKRLARQARELRRDKVLDQLIRGHIDTFAIADKLNVSERTVRRDKAVISKHFTAQFKLLGDAVSAIHHQMLLSYYRVLQMANELIDTSQDPNVKIASGYLVMSATNKILEVTGSGPRLMDHYLQAFRKKTEIERRASMEGRLRR